MLRPTPLLALTASTFAVGLGELAVAGILPPLTRDLHVSIPLAGQLTGLYALVFAVLTPPLAALFGGAHRKQGLIAGLVLVAAGNVAGALAPSFALLLASRLLAAAGSALVSPLSLSLIDDVIPLERRGNAQGIVFAGFSTAMTVGVPLGALVADRFGWRWVFAAVALTALAAALLAARLDFTGPRTAPDPWSAARSLFTPAVARLLAISFFILAAQYAVFPYLRPYLTVTASYGLGASAFLLFLLGAFGTVGNIAGGMSLDRWGTRRSVAACVAANIALFVAMRFVAGPLTASAVLFALWAVASWAYAPAVNVALTHETGEHRDVALAVNMTAFNLAIAAGAALGGAVIAAAGVANVVLLGAALLVPALALSARLPGRRRSAPPSAHCS